MLQSMGSQKDRRDLATEQQQQQLDGEHQARCNLAKSSWWKQGGCSDLAAPMTTAPPVTPCSQSSSLDYESEEETRSYCCPVQSDPGHFQHITVNDFLSSKLISKVISSRSLSALQLIPAMKAVKLWSMRVMELLIACNSNLQPKCLWKKLMLIQKLLVYIV